MTLLAERIAAVEGQLSMLSANFASHAMFEQSQTAQMHATLERLSGQVKMMYDAIGNVMGSPSNFMRLTEEIKGARGLTKRMWGLILGLAAIAATLITLSKCLPD